VSLRPSSGRYGSKKEQIIGCQRLVPKETDDPVYADRRNFYKPDWYDRSAIDNQTASALIWTPLITLTWKEPIMKRFIVAALVGLTIAASFSTSASAFRCLATSSNGVNTWGYGIVFSRAARFAVRHCRVAGGVDCRIAYCR
jgi:hypothetical protein